MLTITRKDLLLTINDNVIPAMGSSDVPVKFVNDEETYQGFMIEPRIGYYVNGCPKSTVCEYSNDIIKIPAEAFKNKGILVIAIALIDNEDSNHIEVTKELALEVTPAPNGTVIFPATDTWQTAVSNLVEQLYNQDYKIQFDEIEENLHNLVKEAQNQQNKANNQQTQIDNAIDIMGDYEIVQDNPTQIRFKKGDGTYGDTVNLGDNLASKSMVNAGYDTYSGNSYSGSASDYGIEIGKASGNYEQVETNGYQLFDASQLPTKTMAGATITNNGDGSFTISGSGNTSEIFEYVYFINDVELIRKLLKVGNITAVVDEITTPRLIFQLYVNGNSTPVINLDLNSSKSKTANITQDYLDNAKNLRIGFYASASTTIQQATIKPMVYQDGDGTWERFTGGEPAPNPNYPLEPKFFEPKEFVSVGKNLYDKNSVIDGIYINMDNGLTTSLSYASVSNYIPIIPNTNYVTTRKDGSGHGLAFFDKNKTYIKGLNISQMDSFVTPENAYYVRINAWENQSWSDGMDKETLMLCQGDSLPNYYVPFEGQDTTPLKIELRSLPNGVRDTYENGVITRRVGYIEFDGSEDEDWKLSSVNNVFGIYILNKKYSQSVPLINLLCNKLTTEKWNIPISEMKNFSIKENGNQSDSIIYIKIDSIESIQNLKSWLKSNPIKVWYQLATPTTEQVDLPVIPSYFPYTNAWHDSEVEASDLTWNILAGQYGSGQTTIKKDEAVLTELDLNTERTVSPTTVKVQLKDTSGNTFYVETSTDNVYLKGTDGSEITQKSLNDKIGQLINLVAFYSANPTTVLADLKKYITTIT